jgi:hypothetical protein
MCFLSLIIWFKALYFMQLLDKLSPLIRIIFVVFHDILPFMLVFIITGFGFVNSYYLIGRNQIEFDGLTEDEEPPYSHPLTSLIFVWQMTFGEVGGAMDYGKGNGNNYLPLWILFICCSF